MRGHHNHPNRRRRRRLAATALLVIIAIPFALALAIGVLFWSHRGGCGCAQEIRCDGRRGPSSQTFLERQLPELHRLAVRRRRKGPTPPRSLGLGAHPASSGPPEPRPRPQPQPQPLPVGHSAAAAATAAAATAGPGEDSDGRLVFRRYPKARQILESLRHAAAQVQLHLPCSAEHRPGPVSRSWLRHLALQDSSSGTAQRQVQERARHGQDRDRGPPRGPLAGEGAGSAGPGPDCAGAARRGAGMRRRLVNAFPRLGFPSM